MNDSTIEKLFHFDVEVVTQYKNYSELLDKDPAMAKAWEVRSRSYTKFEEYKDLKTEELLSATYHDKAGLMPEFGKVIVIANGMKIFKENKGPVDYIKAYAMDDEIEILNQFKESLNSAAAKKPGLNLCGYNIKGFDMPYVSKRMLINDISLPQLLNNGGRKPWEIPAYDLFEVWQQGSRDMVSLELVCISLGIPTPKDGISGSEVGDVYWNAENRLEAVDRISAYCQRDVKATINIVDKLKNLI
jgi:3'-5' exonuclease